MKTQLNMLKFMICTVAIMCMLLMGCNSKPSAPAPERTIDIAGPVKVIQSEVKKTIELAEDIKDKAPEVTTEADGIIYSQNTITGETVKLMAAEKNVKLLKKDVKNISGDLKDSQKFAAKESKRADEAEANKTSIMMWILYGFLTVGMLLIVAAPLMFFWGRVEASKCIGTGVTGGLMAGVAMFIIRYMVIILWGIGGLAVLTGLFVIYQLYMYSKKSGIAEDLHDSFHLTDKEEINKLQSKATQLFVSNKKIAKRTKAVKGAKNGGTNENGSDSKEDGS